jgi:hypothetical protein
MVDELFLRFNIKERNGIAKDRQPDTSNSILVFSAFFSANVFEPYLPRKMRCSRV